MRTLYVWCFQRLSIRMGLFITILLGVCLGAWAIAIDLHLVRELHKPQAKHVTQAELNAIADPHKRFKTAFEVGDGSIR